MEKRGWNRQVFKRQEQRPVGVQSDARKDGRSALDGKLSVAVELEIRAGYRRAHATGHQAQTVVPTAKLGASYYENRGSHAKSTCSFHNRPFFRNLVHCRGCTAASEIR